jgi:hypothetical protein
MYSIPEITKKEGGRKSYNNEININSENPKRISVLVRALGLVCLFSLFCTVKNSA